MSLSTLYNNLKNLIKQFTYTKSEIDTELDTRIGDINDYIDSNLDTTYIDDISDTVSNNDMRPVTSNAVYEALSNIDVEDSFEDLLDIAIAEEEEE